MTGLCNTNINMDQPDAKYGCFLKIAERPLIEKRPL